MPNRQTKGTALVGDLKGKGGAKAIFEFRNTVARTDTAAKMLFTLPKDFVPTELEIFGAAVSNAGTTATISVGKTGGSGTEYLNGFDVKGATGSGQQNPTAAALLGTQLTVDTGITAIYAETGVASTLGGPWTVIIRGTLS